MPDIDTPSNTSPSQAAYRASSAEPTERASASSTSHTLTPFEDDRRLDGNAAGGALGAIFPFEMTMARATCAGCGTRNVLGAAMAYMHGMGTILRCPMCDTALIRVAHIRGRYFLDLRGMQVLQIAEPDDVIP